MTAVIVVLMVATGVALVWHHVALARMEDAALIQRHLRDAQERNHFVHAFARHAVPPHDGHEIVPVETGGEIVARLCVTCDKQLAP